MYFKKNLVSSFFFQDDTNGDAKDEDGEEKKERYETDNARDKGATQEASTSKDAKVMAKEAVGNLPKIHKPAFLKKSKKEGDGEEGLSNNTFFLVCFL